MNYSVFKREERYFFYQQKKKNETVSQFLYNNTQKQVSYHPPITHITLQTFRILEVKLLY